VPRPGRFTLGPTTRYPLYGRLFRASGPVWTVTENSTVIGVRTRTFQSVASIEKFGMLRENFSHRIDTTYLEVESVHKLTDELQACLAVSELQMHGGNAIWSNKILIQAAALISPAAWISCLLLVKIPFPRCTCYPANTHATRLECNRYPNCLERRAEYRKPLTTSSD